MTENNEPITQEEPNEGQKLAEIIARDGRTLRELAKLLDVDFTWLSYKRLSGTKRLKKEFATKAIQLFGLPHDYFLYATPPGDISPAAVIDEYAEKNIFREIRKEMADMNLSLESAHNKLDSAHEKLDLILNLINKGE